MATQIIPDGGFIGRLGEVVGQRWHNKRFVRTYVVPHDPKTEAQLTNRELFKRATNYTKLSMEQSGRWGLFDTTRMGEYAARLGQARRALGAGDTGRLLLPITPTAGQTIIQVAKVIVNAYSYGVVELEINTVRDFEEEGVFNAWIWKFIDNDKIKILGMIQEEAYGKLFYVSEETTDFVAGDTIHLTACWRKRQDIISPIGVMLPVTTVIKQGRRREEGETALSIES